MLADHPKYLLEDGELDRFRPEMVTPHSDGAVTTLTSVRLPIRCDACASALSVGESHAGGAAVVPIAAGVTVVLVTLCAECEWSLVTPSVRTTRVALD